MSSRQWQAQGRDGEKKTTQVRGRERSTSYREGETSKRNQSGMRCKKNKRLVFILIKIRVN